MTADLNYLGFFTRPTLTQFADMMYFDTMPLYALLHEPLYARGYALSDLICSSANGMFVGVPPIGLLIER